jgi:pimeloyl-ACP methyl ester carboxylesterase
MLTVFFLPGAGGSPEFWKPVAERLPADWEKVLFGWPGLGDQPHDPTIKSLEDLVHFVEARIESPIDLVAQSVGGLIATRIAIKRPELVRRLVLVVTSGGVDVARFGGADWRPAFLKTFPNTSRWIVEKEAVTEVPVEKILSPTLLIWGNADDISPIGVGQHLLARIPSAKLHVLAGGDHYIASNMSDQVAQLIAAHLVSPAS